MNKEALILAGGLGTRLRSLVPNAPKPMADINGKPFLSYLLRDLAQKGFRSVILAVGYKADSIKDFFGESFEGVTISYSVETEPLGTGGAVKKALRQIQENDFFIMNGDTFFDVPYDLLSQFYRERGSEFTLVLKKVTDSDRYGSVVFDNDLKVVSFREKQFLYEGYINGGVYISNKDYLKALFDSYPARFSFEKDFLEKMKGELLAFPHDGYFIDIGIPEDYARAIRDFKELAYR